jgi:putative ABC transport system ATP-binding protein
MAIVLEIRNLVKRLGAEFCLSAPHFSVERGEDLAIVGASGSGKTTLLHIIAGIIAPDEGVVRVSGVDIVAMSESKRDRFRAAHIGCVYQTFNLLQGLTARENILAATLFAGGGAQSARDEAEERLERLAERFGIRDKLRQKPRELSVGEQQRVAVARALINKPALILADEPTASVDAHNARAVIDAMRELAREEGASVIAITHDAAAQAMFSRSVALQDIVAGKA